MRILTARRITQFFFVLVFIWFCLVTSLGDRWYQLRGWPVNWIIQLDPLVGLSTVLSTRTLYAGLLWGLATTVLTILLGRFFCGWMCPLGTFQQFFGWLARRRLSMPARVAQNRYHPWQSLKYWILCFLLAMSALDAAASLIRTPSWLTTWPLVPALIILVVWLWRPKALSVKFWGYVGSLAVIWLLAGFVLHEKQLPPAPLQIGLLDPIPLVYRSINLIILPLADSGTRLLSVTPRQYDGNWLIAAIFLTILLLSTVVPRFFCRFVCPLGALFGVFGRFALWRIGKSRAECLDCHLCEKNCEGACEPSTQIRQSECVLCLNCLNDCHHGLMTYRTRPSAAGELSAPDLTRRALAVSFVSGALAVPMLRLNGHLGANWNPQLIRPPGSLPEPEFLARCIKCGQCMRICPTNVIHPAGFEAGLEGLWTPVLNFRIGTSGCQVNCIACGNLCPTAAIRPISLTERQGSREFADQGPIRIGTAFVDPGRCLPWSMDRPCIVCQENCPVSPKAIFTREVFNPIRGPALSIQVSESLRIEFGKELLPPGGYATGDYYCTVDGINDQRPRKIVRNSADSLELAPDLPFESPPPAGSRVILQIRLQRPYVDPRRCIGCGVCEHECPVPGKRAIRVTADNESRNRNHALLL